MSQKLDIFLSINDIYVIPAIPHNPPTSVNMLFENFKLGFIDSISADTEFCKDISKVSVQLQTLTSLQNFVESCEKSAIMIKSFLKQNQQIRSQARNFGQNGSNFTKNGKNARSGPK